MKTHERASRVVVGALAVAAIAGAAEGVPSYSVLQLYRSGQNVPGSGVINSAFMPGLNGGTGFTDVSIVNSGDGYLRAGIFADDGFDATLLHRSTGLAAYLPLGFEGYLPAPFADHAATGLFALDTANDGTGVFVVSLGNGEFSVVTPTSGVLLHPAGGTKRLIAEEGGNAGAPGFTFAPFAAGGDVVANDQRQYLVGTTLNGPSGPVKALVLIATDVSGNVTSTSIVARDGGLVGAGPQTWTQVSISPHTFDLNNAGTVLFSGITSGGTEGLYRTSTNSFVLTKGQATPGGDGGVWGPLLGVPVDLNNSGSYAVRGRFGDTVLFNEAGDAGETFATAALTYGAGSLDRIAGSLSNDHDVDIYRIRVTDGASFSATTVPNPGMGFAGTTADTVLYLLRPFHNFNGSTRTGLARNNDAAPGVPQSTLTSANIPENFSPNADYYLVISTPKARALGQSTRATTAPMDDIAELWQSDPAVLEVAGGTLYWNDVSDGKIRRVDTTSGSSLADLPVSLPPDISVGTGEEMSRFVETASGKVYWMTRLPTGAAMRRANTDGTGVETLPLAGVPTFSIGTLSGLAADAGAGKLYWCCRAAGEVWTANLDGTSPVRLIRINLFDGIPAASATFAPQFICVDGTGGKLYWHNAYSDRIQRSNLDGTMIETLTVGAGAGGLAVDAAGGKIYWTNTAGNAVMRSNLDGGGAETFVSTPSPVGVAVAASEGRVYFSSTQDRIIRRALIASPVAADFAAVAPDVGDHCADGDTQYSPFYGWAKHGTPSGGAVAYQIKLTGATFYNTAALIAVDNTRKVAAVGDTPAGIAPAALTQVGTATGPVKLSDHGAVFWRGQWSSSSTDSGLFVNDEVVLRYSTAPNNGGPQIGSLNSGAGAFDASDDGTKVMAITFYGAFADPADNCVAVEFSEPPTGGPAPCPADFNGVNGVTVQDIFDFLTAWLAGNPSADFNHVNGVTVQDIFDFLTAWLAGC